MLRFLYAVHFFVCLQTVDVDCLELLSPVSGQSEGILMAMAASSQRGGSDRRRDRI